MKLMVSKGQKSFFESILHKRKQNGRKMKKMQVQNSNAGAFSLRSVVSNGRFAGAEKRWVICRLERKKVRKSGDGAII